MDSDQENEDFQGEESQSIGGWESEPLPDAGSLAPVGGVNNTGCCDDSVR